MVLSASQWSPFPFPVNTWEGGGGGGTNGVRAQGMLYRRGFSNFVFPVKENCEEKLCCNF